MFDWLKRAVSAATGWAPTDDRWYRQIWGGVPTQSGVNIDEDIALTYAAVFMIVSKYAKTMATLPVHVFERVSDRERQPVDHYLNEIFTTEAAPDTTGLTLRETMQANVMLWGNAYAEIVRSHDMVTIQQLVPMPSREITPKRTTNGALVFEHRPEGGEARVLPADRVFRVPGLSLNGVAGLSKIGYMRESLGLGMAATDMAASYYGNSAFMGGFVQRASDKEAGSKLSPDAGQQLVADLENKFRGAKKAFGIGLIRDGMKYESIKIPLVDAELLASRKASVIDMCGIFDMPPAKIHRLEEGGKWNNVAEQDTAWAKDSLLPECVRFEIAVRAQLLPPDGNLYFRHNLAGIMRGAFMEQNEAFAIGRINGWFSVNDIRGYLDLNPIAGGDVYLEPLNMVPVGQPRSRQTPRREDDEDEEALAGRDPSLAICEDRTAIFAPLVQDVANRVADKERMAVDKALTRLGKTGDSAKFATWLDKFYSGHVEYIAVCLKPLAEAFVAATGRELQSFPADVAEAYVESNYDTLNAIAEDPIKLSGVLKEWQETKAEALTAGIMRLLEESLSKTEIITKTPALAG